MQTTLKKSRSTLKHAASRSNSMKNIMSTVDVFVLGLFLVNIACKLISNEAFGKALFAYIVVRFILKRITK